ncbi:hypothetical protein HZS_4265, partial [Henneguya salminicola]
MENIMDLDHKKIHKTDEINYRNKIISEKFYVLNKQFLTYLQYCHESNKNCDFTPVLNDYINYSNKIRGIEIQKSPILSEQLSLSTINNEEIHKATTSNTGHDFGCFKNIYPCLSSGKSTSLLPADIFSPSQPTEAPAFIEPNFTLPNSNLTMEKSFGFSTISSSHNTSAHDTFTSFFNIPSMAVSDTLKPLINTNFPAFSQASPFPAATTSSIFSSFSTFNFPTSSSLPSNPFLTNISSTAIPTPLFSTAPTRSFINTPNTTFGGTSNLMDDQDEAIPESTDMGYEPSSLCSVRAKLFFLNMNKFSEIGVGIFNIKAIESNSNQLQLIFRIESCRHGNILMNIKIEKNGKNIQIQNEHNLIITSVPNPPLKEVLPRCTFETDFSTVSYLLKTKTASDMKLIQ